MTAAPAMQRETVGLIVVPVWPLRPLIVLRRVAAGDEGRQPIDVARAFGRIALRRARLLRLMLLVLRLRLRVARDVGLRLARAERLFARAHPRLAVVVAVLESVIARVARVVVGPGVVVGPIGLRIALAELLLRRGNQTEIMFGVLIVIFGRDRITGGLRVASELNVLFRDVRRISANLHVRAVRLVYARHRIVTLAVLVAPAHALVLSVSHDSPVCQPLRCGGRCRHASPKSLALTTRAARRQPRPRPSSRKSNAAPFAARQVPICEAATPCRGSTAALPTSSLCMAASLVARPVHRTVEASRPKLANSLPGHPASFVRSIRAIGSPK